MKHTRKPDPFTARAHKEGYPARSIYKLEEIDRRCQLLKQGQRVLDLGAAPGSWARFLAQKVGARGAVVALDLNPPNVVLPPHVTWREVDVFQCAPDEVGALGPFDLVVSDMAPHTTGIRDADTARSEELVERALVLSDASLRKGGHFVAKIFQGGGFDAVRASVRTRFETVRVIKPEASRKESFEIYLVGLSRRDAPPERPSAPATPDAPSNPPTEAP